MVQGGDPLGTGKGGESIWGGPFPAEFHQDNKHDRRGMVSGATGAVHFCGRSVAFSSPVPLQMCLETHSTCTAGSTSMLVLVRLWYALGLRDYNTYGYYAPGTNNIVGTHVYKFNICVVADVLLPSYSWRPGQHEMAPQLILFSRASSRRRFKGSHSHWGLVGKELGLGDLVDKSETHSMTCSISRGCNPK